MQGYIFYPFAELGKGEKSAKKQPLRDKGKRIKRGKREKGEIKGRSGIIKL